MPNAAPHVAAIVNPRSGGGKTGRAWRLMAKALENELGTIRVHFTGSASTPHYLPAAELTRKALHEGAQLVIAVGGDGTINEVVNGFYENDQPINREAHLALIHAGTGGDFRKTFEMGDDMDACIKTIASGHTRQIDIGQLSFIAEDGREATRYFANIASFGLSGAVDRAVNTMTWPKLFGGKFTFLWATLTTALRFKPQPVRLTTDGGYDEVVNVGTAAIANGRYFGGGMKMAPHAEPDDGLFDIVILRDTTLSDLMGGGGSLYEGTHIDHEKTISLRGATLTATSVDGQDVLLDIDGEAPGRLPAQFRILPGAITLRC
ncbi:MAG: YegS/Rv2252/BmrU family lipid kinase [Rhizobiales bacterium]|nr:YegS/Rv2252/BmrU family lipid kinase [Hyphomicrobiales bacterium]